MKKPARRNSLAVFVLVAAVGTPTVLARQEKPTGPPSPEEMLVAAREIMQAQQYCALVTLDAGGAPAIRTMNPFPPDEAMVVWMATSTRSLKVEQIRRDPRVTLYYADHAKAIGYVALSGRAVLVDDMQEILKRKRAYRDASFPGLKNLVLIKVVPERVEVVNYKRGLSGDPVTFRPPSMPIRAK
jgi:general stress protein 26